MNFEAVIDYVESFLRNERKVPGCDLKIMRNHETLLRYSSGFADYDGQKPVSDKDMYYMYSCSKPITCTAALQLVEQGVFDLDDPVSRFLPEYAKVFLMKDGERVAPKREMMIRNLFTMSAGLDYNLKKDSVLELLDENPHASTIDVVNAFARSPLCFEPGEKFYYSLCHDVLAAVVEAASGMKYSEYLKKNIFEPLGMERTGFKLSSELLSNMAAQYECVGDGCVRPFTSNNEYIITDNYESGGAGLISCVDDYSKFADAMANGGVGANGARILKAGTIELMRTEQLSSCVENTEFACAAGPGYGYGLGVRTLTSQAQGQRSPIGEFGWDGAAGSYIMMDPENGVSITFSMHVRNWPGLIGCGHAPIRDRTYEALGL